MSRPVVPMLGRTFGTLTVLRKSRVRAANKAVVWICRCIACGRKRRVRGTHLRSGHAGSCTCLPIEARPMRVDA